MPSFLVESYLASPDRERFAELARSVRRLEAGTAIRHVGSLLLLEEEICIHVFEAPSAAALVDAGRLVGLEHERVIETIWIAGAPDPKVVESV